jgi:PAS domain S-box-containing protein
VCRLAHRPQGGNGGGEKARRRVTPPKSQALSTLDESRRWQLLIDSVSDYAIYLLDPDGFVVSWNTGATRIKGYKAKEIVGQHFSKFFTDEDRARQVPQEALAAARRFGRYEHEGWRVRRDGSRFWVLGVIEAIRGDNGELLGFAKITRDMTERRQAEEAIRESERRFRLLVDSVVDYAIFMLDPSGIVTNWNTGAARIKGYTAGEIVGQHFSRFYTPEDRASGLPLRALDTAAREGRYESEGWRMRKDGSRFFASVVIDAIHDETGELIGFAKVTRDITERRATQEAIRESERQFRMLVQGVTDHALYQLDPNGIITTWNAGGERLKLYKPDEIIGQHFSRFYTEADRSAGLPARALYTAAQEGRFEGEGWRVRKDGSIFWANVVIDAIRDENGALVGYAKITRDISERRAAQAQIDAAREQLAHAQKMEALGQLTGGVAHDFNNLLTIISGHAQLLARRTADAKDQRAVEAIQQASARGEQLTRQLLAFSRRQPLKASVIDLRQRVGAFRDLLAGSVTGNVKLVVSILPDVWPVEADPTELDLALVNIAVNARDAMPNGGVITLEAQNRTLRRGEVPGDLEGNFVAISMADSGVGIPPDILPRVFDPFFTTKSPEKGTGLGLSQVYGFAHQSGGAVTVKSEIGKGTTVTLHLPRAQAKLETDAATAGFDSAGGGHSVLFVEDNPDVARVGTDMLEQLGYRVHGVASAAAALDLLRAGSKIDLVFSDILMPGEFDGMALARTVREEFPQLPVLLATGYSKAADSAHRDFPILRKPYQIAELGRVVNNLIASAQGTPAANLVRFPGGRKK